METCALPLELETLLVDEDVVVEASNVVDLVEDDMDELSVVELLVVEPVASSDAVDVTATFELELVLPLYVAAASHPNPAEAATPARAVPMVTARRR